MLALSGGYADEDSGQVTSAVTGLYPWIGFKPSERVTVWTVAGYGAGSLMLQPGAGAPIETGLSMAMAAGGGRGELVATDAGFEPAFKADALWVGTRTDAAGGPGGNLESTRVVVSRLRTAIEGSQSLTVASRLELKPSLELGIPSLRNRTMCARMPSRPGVVGAATRRSRLEEVLAVLAGLDQQPAPAALPDHRGRRNLDVLPAEARAADRARLDRPRARRPVPVQRR